MIPIGKQWYAENFPERSQALKEAMNWTCEWCGRKHGEENTPDMVQLVLKHCKQRKRRKKRKVVVVAHHPNFDTENPDAELIILCRACHGKAQRQHNREEQCKAVDARKRKQRRNKIKDAIDNGQQEIPMDDGDYPVIQVDYPIIAFLQSVPSH